MGNNPFILAAKAAHAELSSETAKSFFKDTALQHIGLVVFYIAEAILYTVEAGKMTRALVNSWRTLETVSTKPKTAGLLPPATLTSPLTTSATEANEQKLQQHIITTIKGIYDVQIIHDHSDQDGVSGNCPDVPECVGLVHKPVSTRTQDHQDKSSAAATRKRKPRASGGNPGKADDSKTKGRMPRSRHQVFAQ
jgi:hypothetical protein